MSGPPSAAPARILITGASGCVGQYVAEALLRSSDAELLLLLRDPAKLTAVDPADPRITLLVGDLRELEPHAEALASVTRIIHTATAWGDPERAQQVNVVAVKRMLELVDPARLEQMIYFSTASILDRDLRLLPEALAHGTEYIQTKAQCLEQLEHHPLAERIVAVFPTWCSGAASSPEIPIPPATSPAACGRPCAGCGWRSGCGPMPRSTSSMPRTSPRSAPTWPPARMLRTRSPARAPCGGWCWGQAPITVNQTVRTLCRWRRSWWPPVALDLRGWLINGLIRLLRIEITPWDCSRSSSATSCMSPSVRRSASGG